MDNPVSKLARFDRRERERRNGPKPEGLAASAMCDPAAPEPSATTAEPDPGHASSVAPETEPRSVGFTSAIGHLSLYGWLRWIHANRSDATLRVHTDEGSGNIWCSAGQIIDAEWEGLGAEEALSEMLPCSSGAVTIDFDPVQRPSRVATPTQQLLHVTEGVPARDSADTGQIAAAPVPPQSGPSSTPRTDRFTELALLLAESVAPVAGNASVPPKPQRKRPGRSDYVAGALVIAALAVAGFAVGRLRATSGLARSSASEQAPGAPVTPAPAQPPRSAPVASPPEPAVVTPKARELPPIPFVSIEVEPAYAEIWLDRELVGRGTLQLAAIHDGMLHELRFTAPEHESKTLFFRSAPPAGRVLLNHVAERAQVEPPKRARPRAAAAAPSPSPPRTRPLPPDTSAPTKPSSQRSPRVELIEVQTPRVQVLD